MKRLSIPLIIIVLLINALPVFAQSGTTTPTPGCPTGTLQPYITQTPGVPSYLDPTWQARCSHCMAAASTPTPCYCATLIPGYQTATAAATWIVPIDPVVPTAADSGQGGINAIDDPFDEGTIYDCPCYYGLQPTLAYPTGTPGPTPTTYPHIYISDWTYQTVVTGEGIPTFSYTNDIVPDYDICGQDRLVGVRVLTSGQFTETTPGQGQGTSKLYLQGNSEFTITTSVYPNRDPYSINTCFVPEQNAYSGLTITGEQVCNVLGGTRATNWNALYGNYDYKIKSDLRTGFRINGTVTFNYTFACYGESEIIPTSTPTPTMTPTPGDCANPEYYYTPPVVQFTGIEFLYTSCHTIIPAFELVNPFNSETLFDFVGVGLCIDWYSSPAITIFGIDMPIGAVLIVPVAWLLITFLRF